MELTGKAALVTGAGSRGIGRAIALALARAGADVAIHALDQAEAAAELAAEIRGMGRRSAVVLADLSRADAARRMVREAWAAMGAIDILVNNASTIVRKPFLELTDDDFDCVIAVNLRGYFAVAQETVAAMVRRGAGGRIVMVSSVNQELAVHEQAAYCASKGGVRQLARVMALELAGHGITVNLIAPGTVETDLNRARLADPAFRRLREDPVPMRRLGQPEDIAAAAVYFAGPGAAYVTGATITVDGGLSLP